MVARRYGFFVRVHKIHIFELPCNVLFITLTFTVLPSFVQPKQISLKSAVARLTKYPLFLCILYCGTLK